jgi:hypothetical protein
MATVNTSWVSPTSATLDKATGATIDEAMTDGWSSDLYHLGGAQGYIGVRAYNVSPQSVADATAVALSLNAEQFDHDPNGSIHDAGGVPVSNTAVTIRTTGVYHLTGFVRFSPNTTGVRSASFRISGATKTSATRPAGATPRTSRSRPPTSSPRPTTWSWWSTSPRAAPSTWTPAP